MAVHDKSSSSFSDSHSYIDDRILEYASQADEVWHCGDFGSLDVIEQLEK